MIEDHKHYPFAMAIKIAIEQTVARARGSFPSIKRSLDEFEDEVSDAEFGRIIYDAIRAAVARREAKMHEYHDAIRAVIARGGGEANKSNKKNH